ncbi:MAG: 2-oxoacid:acceptor oxidoreductase family protein [Candidatus Nanoarchaeia archaeon]|nr:2-oxoacid:acceptor oxidoreductase family protein [Candidatus Nanoarchaeia archaeon]MDD5357663.1 2-oxoacid:acceptor oxidoreductase family protein [Candidatus Nanoarchaeia archaeon]MDD5588582.1 2-oxoacid:acceptor oxidoreductase family protein [Candidatus Nanoarchaeia archaeon]
MRFSILFGGKAGQGVNVLSNILGNALTKKGQYVFVSRDYQSLIRGGHNFNVLTFSDKPVASNDSQIDMIIALDENTINLHRSELKKGGKIIEKEGKGNMYFAGRIFKLLCVEFSVLEEELRELKFFEENIKDAKEGYNETSEVACKVSLNKNKLKFVNGNQGISEGAVKSGVDIYYAYPMTPATNVMGELAEKQIENNNIVIELESEVAVINAAIGSAITGAKTMIGTSGGGFDLMTEALSLTGVAEVPLVIYLASRPGPSTGVATYTGQGDLDLARHSGHGEFNRLVIAPGDPKECEELTSQAFYFSQKFGIPTIILSDKHLAEGLYTMDKNSVITPSKKMTSLKRYNSYETDEFGCATEDAEKIIKNVDARMKMGKEIEKEAEKFSQFNVYGNRTSKNVVLFWGSTKGAIIDAMENLDAKFVQVLYLEPFPMRIKKEIEGKNIILVENNATGQLGKLVAEKTGIFIDDKNKILRYDGRPFLADELREELGGRLK